MENHSKTNIPAHRTVELMTLEAPINLEVTLPATLEVILAAILEVSQEARPA